MLKGGARSVEKANEEKLARLNKAAIKVENIVCLVNVVPLYDSTMSKAPIWFLRLHQDLRVANSTLATELMRIQSNSSEVRAAATSQ
jgi:fructose-1,6-bisphosphatase/sedoheptulose 1,7-bisphosphatase-like protein